VQAGELGFVNYGRILAGDSCCKDFAMEKTFRREWIVAGGLLVGGAIVLGPVSETIRDATDVCGIGRQTIACAPAITGDPDLPHRDRVQVNAGTITVTVTSTATSATLGTTPSTTVTDSSR
jgi:hypothetical protein